MKPTCIAVTVTRLALLICRLTLVAIISLSPLMMVQAQNLNRAAATPSASHLKLLFIGDIMGHDTQIAAAFNPETGEYNYNSVFRYVAPFIKEADIAIANLEVTLAGPPYKGYPNFSSPASFAAAAQEAGIGIMVTANNHCADRGLEGIVNTIFCLDSLGLAHTGTYLNKEERRKQVPLVIEKNNIRLALLNYTYGTNGIPVPPPAIVDHISRKVMASDIESAKKAGVNGIIVFVHWGIEYDTIPGEEQASLADWLISKGVNMVIGSHPHVLQPMYLVRKNDSDTDVLIAYSLGNFVSNQRNRRTDGGAMLSVTLSADEKGLTIEDAGYILTWVYTPSENGIRKFYILPASEHENNSNIITDPEAVKALRFFLNDSRRLLGTHPAGLKEVR